MDPTTNSTKPTSKKRSTSQSRTKVQVTVSCLRCNKPFVKSYLYFGSKTKIVCSGLNQHLTRKQECNNYYMKHFLTKNGDFDFIHSLSDSDLQEHRDKFVSKRANTIFLPSDFGLTGTRNGPISVIHPDFHEPDLNKQTIHDVNQPQVSRDAITNHVEPALDSELTTDKDQDAFDNHSQFDDSTDFGSTLSGNTTTISHIIDSPNTTPQEADIVTENINDARVVPDPINFEQMNPQLSSEVELLNICRQLKAPLNGARLIWEWAMKSQQKKGFDFARLPNCRTRETVLKDVRRYAQVPVKDDFDKKLLKWLPSNNAVELCVRPFKTVLFSLLAKKELVVQENLSLPHSTNPYSYVNDPPVHTISELHHGHWWARTWAKRCVEDRKEILVPIILYMDGIALDTHGRQNLTPLNLSLGIFNTKTRRRPEAWELVYFQPDPSLSLIHI